MTAEKMKRNKKCQAVLLKDVGVNPISISFLKLNVLEILKSGRRWF